MKKRLPTIQTLYFLIKPRSKDEDLARKEFILNVLLLGGIFLSIIAIICASISFLYLTRQGKVFHGTSIYTLTLFFLFFLTLYIFSKLGSAKKVSYIFAGIFSFFAIYTSYRWGTYAPQALLIFSLSIIMSGILINSHFAFLNTFFSIITIFLLFNLQNERIILIDSDWMKKPIKVMDIVVYTSTLLIISVVFWLSNREIEKSLRRAKKSEAELKIERDMLEVTIQKRTEELRKIQYEKMRQLYRFAEFGRISSGLFHDLINYLTALSLNLEKAKEVGKEEAKSTQKYLEGALRSSSKMEDFIEAIQKQLKNQTVNAHFSFAQEIEQVIQVLNYKANKQKVEIIFSFSKDIFIFGNPLKFNQIITNLLSNAIDSYANFSEEKNRKVLLEFEKEKDLAVIKIQDWGAGIPQENLEKIFDPFFSTKDYRRGTGIGLSTTKEIVEKDFQGKIEVESKENKGTTFLVMLPIKDEG